MAAALRALPTGKRNWKVDPVSGQAQLWNNELFNEIDAAEIDCELSVDGVVINVAVVEQYMIKYRESEHIYRRQRFALLGCKGTAILKPWNYAPAFWLGFP